MATHEWLAVGYFAALAVAAQTRPLPWRRRVAVLAGALTLSAIVAIVAAYANEPLRACAPHLYLVAGYWLPALVAARPSLGRAGTSRFERWLMRSDAVLRPSLPTVPHALTWLTELGYLVCYPLIPIACWIIWTRGNADDVDRFWVAILAAGYVCYGSLLWLVSRPPRLIPSAPFTPPAPLALPLPVRLNVLLLGRVSHGLNTFPSGHVALSFAAAAMVVPVAPVFAAAMGVVALVIAVGAIAGRYHFVVDVLLAFVVTGAAVALAMGF